MSSRSSCKADFCLAENRDELARLFQRKDPVVLLIARRNTDPQLIAGRFDDETIVLLYCIVLCYVIMRGVIRECNCHVIPRRISRGGI